VPGGAIDYLCGHFTPETIRKHYLDPRGDDREVFESVGRADTLRGYEPAEFVEYLRAAGVDKVLVPSFVAWSWRQQRTFLETAVAEVVAVRQAAPDVIHGLYGVNPRRGMDAVAELERAVLEHGFRGIHIHPHGWELPPNHQYYFPFYAKCHELDVAVVVSMGHTLEPMHIEYGRPFFLDDVALYFPRLRIVCAHTGWPWVEEAIALASKHPNVYVGTSAYAPKYWRPELVQFLNSRRGRDKVLWGTDWPLVKHDEALRQIDALGLREESKQRLIRENAARVFGFE
jgi:uncharacterized protein